MKIRDMQKADEYFVSTCSHINESNEIDACAQRMLSYLKDNYKNGLCVKVALVDGNHAGFLYMMPIEICPWGPLGQDLSVIPCLFVLKKLWNKGIGQALITEAEKEIKHQNRKAIVVVGFYHDFWFMPAPFFEKCGFSVVQRKDKIAILWKVFDKSAKPPKLLNRNYNFKPIPGKIAVDLFWNPFCGTSNGEAQRVREVVAEFGDSIVLNEYNAEDRMVLCRYQIPRAIFVNGKEIWYGDAVPKDNIREAITKALKV